MDSVTNVFCYAFIFLLQTFLAVQPTSYASLPPTAAAFFVLRSSSIASSRREHILDYQSREDLSA